jgi:DNA cross-link repair 1A protein
MVTSTKIRRVNTPKKPIATASRQSASKSKPAPNASILSFFKKTDKPEDSLFVGAAPEVALPGADDDIYAADDYRRFNEIDSPVKKRKTSPEAEERSTNGGTNSSPQQSPEVKVSSKPRKPTVRGPFVMDSDSDDDETMDDGTTHLPDPRTAMKLETIQQTEGSQQIPDKPDVSDEVSTETEQHRPAWSVSAILQEAPDTPKLKLEETACESVDDFGEFAEFEDDDLEGYEGEEMREMLYMREQARIEAEEVEGEGSVMEDLEADPADDGQLTERCPICQGSMASVSADEATRHVNSCLDGNPTPLPQENVPVAQTDHAEPLELESSEISKRFSRNQIPKPPQANPLEPSSINGVGRSAFSKLMSNNAEDSAWATAEASEKASRGRPAYQRFCPFYKNMPGLSICVDAFRYGAIEGCKAYFLSHFHSDHYIGLTASWRHGPIYCSKVTGSLVRHQLRTAEKWVVELEFEKQYEVPGTDGVLVTMIPANHCPGSSLFLFEKKTGQGQNPHVKRILHCGDFRACPSHIGHPLLKPDVRDSISGKVRQQKIDICYLDTTYLNPRYSFPPQNDVITACADLCGSMSPNPDAHDDIWDRSSRDLGTPAVSKYFTKVSESGKDAAGPSSENKQRLLVVCGTYSIGKERICLAIAKALNSKIFASKAKIKICKQLGDEELSSRLTSDPLEAQVHMQMLMEIRAETLQEYLNSYKPHFSRIVGFRPSGWNFRPRNSPIISAKTSPGSIATQQILHAKEWKTRFGCKEFVAQRGSTKEAMCFGVPYSEHSSFRELAMFVMGLRIDKIVPTVNVGSRQSRAKMKAWTDRWISERRKHGLVRPLVEGHDEDNDGKVELWAGKSTQGGGCWW